MSSESEAGRLIGAHKFALILGLPLRIFAAVSSGGLLGGMRFVAKMRYDDEEKRNCR